MATLTIYHNGECSKSRGALEIVQEQGIPHTVRWYLTDPLSRDELIALLHKLNIPAAALVRKSEPLYAQITQSGQPSEQEWLGLLAEHPILIERPIAELGSRAIIARPPERILSLLE